MSHSKCAKEGKLAFILTITQVLIFPETCRDSSVKTPQILGIGMAECRLVYRARPYSEREALRFALGVGSSQVRRVAKEINAWVSIRGNTVCMSCLACTLPFHLYSFCSFGIMIPTPL